MDLLLTHQVEIFGLDLNIDNIEESEKFELFCNLCVISSNYKSLNYDLFETQTGKACNGIDGVAIIVNGRHCTSTNDIDEIISFNNYLEVDFVFIQSKMKPNFDNADILNFTAAVDHFFKTPNHFTQIEMINSIEIKNKIFNNANKLRIKPNCFLFYCCAGVWKNDHILKQTLEREEEKLSAMTSCKTQITPFGSEKLCELYIKCSQPTEVKISLEKRIILPSSKNIAVAYSGIMSFEEFKDVIIDTKGNLKRVFEDNVRDFMSYEKSPVNRDIKKTLTSDDVEHFAILNNGITIVAEEITGQKELTLRNYQIVNGCQTSHVLYDVKNSSNAIKAYIPVKVIVTKDSSIKEKITNATNNQKEVNLYQKEALNKFQHKLENYYDARNSSNKIFELYYERRSDTYLNRGMKAFRIVSIESQMKSFAALVLQLPHLVSGHSGSLIRQIGKEIFHEEHRLEAYYTSACAYFLLEQFFKKKKLNRTKYWKYRYLILLIFRILINPEKPPSASSKKSKSYFAKIDGVIKDHNMSLDLFKQAVSIITSNELDLNLHDRKLVEKKETTQTVIRFVSGVKSNNITLPLSDSYNYELFDDLYM